MTTAPADDSLPPVALLLALRFDWRRDEELASAFDSATIAGARALGLTGYGLAPGHAANFILLPADNVSDALARRPHQRTVVSRGAVIARDGKFLESRQS